MAERKPHGHSPVNGPVEEYPLAKGMRTPATPNNHATRL